LLVVLVVLVVFDNFCDGFGPLSFSLDFHQIPHGTVPASYPLPTWHAGTPMPLPTPTPTLTPFLVIPISMSFESHQNWKRLMVLVVLVVFVCFGGFGGFW
jgi:hypothetical protein